MNRKKASPDPRLFAAALRHHQAGRLGEAENLYREILSVDSSHADALHMLGVIAYQTGRWGLAGDLMSKAIAINGTQPIYHFNFGNLLRDLGRPEDAVRAYNAAVRREPDYAEAHNNLGSVLAGLGRLEDAVREYDTAIRLQPNYVQAYANLGLALQSLGRLEEAADKYARAVRLEPRHREAGSQRINCLQRMCAWQGLDQLQQEFLDRISRDSEKFSPFSALVMNSTAAQQLIVAQTWSDRQYARITPLATQPRTEDGKIRLGYLSADFCDHAVAQLVVELIERHDRRRFEVIGYSYGPEDGSAMRKRLIEAFDRFVDIRPLPSADAAKLIHRDGVDVLVDLTGYTTHARTQILAFRPAAVQVNFLGFPGTMGADFIDYIIADSVCIPPGDEVFFREKVVRLATCYQPNDSKRAIAEETPSRAACGLPEQGVVFCCFNNSYKITPAVFAVWMRLLGQVPGSVLWLLEANAAARGNLRREASLAGIAPDRLVFAPRQALPDHLARHRLADLFLDTLPYNAHTTASDALWAGLPVVTCLGKTFAGRVAASLLSAMGMDDLVTSSLAEYEKLAMALAIDPARLTALKTKLAANRDTAPLFDSDRFARSIEAAYSRMVDVR